MSFAYVVSLWSCWNYGYELDIVATTRSNRVHKSFSFVSFNLSTELLEDKQGFKLGEVDDMSPSYILFQTLLPLFWTLICMIWMELTWTDAIFSRVALVLFLCRNQSSPNVLKIYGEQFWKIRKISVPSSTLGGGPVGHKPWLLHHPPGGGGQGPGGPQARPPRLVANGWTPSGWFFRKYFLYIPKIFSVNFQVISRTFISAQKQHHGNSAENSVSPG